MATMTETVFYSWQSDSPGQFNRNFIEEAIKEALAKVKATTALDLSPRDPKMEKDTINVPGSPPITDTILRKIDECAVFVADLTIVGELLAELGKKDDKEETEDKGSRKLFPNSNVVMEYGYALKAHGYTRMIAVTNEAFGGKVQENTLPFNLRHRRWPIRYAYGPSTTPADKKAIKARLVEELAHAISLILQETAAPVVAPQPFVGSSFTPQTFIEMAKAHELLIGGPFGENIPPYEIPGRGLICLRLQPSVRVPDFDSETDAKNAAWQGELLPMFNYFSQGRTPARNAAGGIIYQAPTNGKLVSFTQLFMAKEIYGLDALSSGSNSWRSAKDQQPIFDIGKVEESFVITLRSYSRFAANKLGLPPPWKVQAAVYGVKDHQLHPGTRCLSNEILWETSMTPDSGVLEKLEPFFDLLWKKFGSQRPADSGQHHRQMLADLDSRK